MCGRLARDYDEDDLSDAGFNPQDMAAGIARFDPPRPTYNMSPGRDQYVIVQNQNGNAVLWPMHWGLKRQWTRPGMPTPSNARAETITEKPLFRGLLESRRCLVPANGYYEWKKVGSKKLPYHIRVADQSLMMIAGIYDAWRGDHGDVVCSYTMITTTPAESIAHIHDRMPVIVHPDDYGMWLDRSVRDLGVIQPMLRPYPSELMESWAVSDRVNDTNNDGPDLIEPVCEVRQQPLLVEMLA